jgi:hypothetical protein
MNIKAREWYGNEQGIQRDGKCFRFRFFDLTDFFCALFG